MPILTGPERDYVILKLADTIQADMRAWFVAQCQDEDDCDPAYLRDLPDIKVPKDLAKAAVNLALANNGQKYRGAFATIVGGMGANFDPKLAGLLKTFQAYQPQAPAAGIDPYVSCFLAQKLPFWNRAALRVKLKQVRMGRSILLVNGSPKSGRSYTLQLLTHLALSGEPMQVAPVLPPVTATNKTEITPALLAEKIVEAMELTPNLTTQPAPGGKSNNQYHERLATWVLDHVPEDTPAYWVVVDGVGLDGVDPQCRLFLTALAWKISAGAYQPRLRLILINFPDDDLDALSDVVEIDMACTPSDADIRATIEAALSARNIAYTDGDIQQAFEQIQGPIEVPRTDPKYWRELNRRMRDVLND